VPAKLLNKILVVVPTRSRPIPLIETITSILSTSCGYADVLVVCDPDDPLRLGIQWPRVSTLVLERRGPMLHGLNAAVLSRLSRYSVFGYCGDDGIYETMGWDLRVWHVLRHGVGIAYGDDKIQSQNLPTHPWISREIIEALGFVTPSCLSHYYIDNYLKGLGLSLGRLHYLPDIVTRHRHHSVAGGLSYDTLYQSEEIYYAHDKANFEAYSSSRKLNRDALKVQSWLEGRDLAWLH
jgi:hypothetical protein